MKLKLDMKRSFLKQNAVIALAWAFSVYAYAQNIEASFSESTRHSTYYTFDNDGEKTSVDQWSGTPGRGWSTGWEIITNGSSVRDKQVHKSGGPVGSIGQYIQFRMEASKKNRKWMNSRSYESYGSVDLNAPVRFEFLYRPDDISGFESGGWTVLQIKDGGGLDDNNGATWYITTTQGKTKRWMFGNGDGNGNVDLIDSGMTILEGKTYKFIILSDPSKSEWGVSVEEVDGASAQVVKKGLGYLNSSNAQAGRLNFLTQLSALGDTPTTYRYSLDSIVLKSE